MPDVPARTGPLGGVLVTPTCLICRTKFYGWSYSAPPEDCDCGANFNDEQWREEGGDERRAKLTKRWQTIQDHADDPNWNWPVEDES